LLLYLIVAEDQEFPIRIHYGPLDIPATTPDMTLDKKHTIFEFKIQDWQNGTCIQDAMPELDADQREFILTGVVDEEWQEYIAEI
jgi:hypothetical protein